MMCTTSKSWSRGLGARLAAYPYLQKTYCNICIDSRTALYLRILRGMLLLCDERPPEAYSIAEEAEGARLWLLACYTLTLLALIVSSYSKVRPYFGAVQKQRFALSPALELTSRLFLILAPLHLSPVSPPIRVADLLALLPYSIRIH